MTVGFVLKNPHKAGQSKLDEWQTRLDSKFRKSKEDFAKHFKAKYPGDVPPIWVAVELWDFGTLSHFYSGMKAADRDSIAALYGLASGDILESWLRNLNDVRNFCAHHSRLWNRNMAAQPSWVGAGDVPDLDHLVGQTHKQTRFYTSAVMLQFLLKRINPSSKWGERLIEHVATLPQNPYVTLDSAGFFDKWFEESIWK